MNIPGKVRLKYFPNPNKKISLGKLLAKPLKQGEAVLKLGGRLSIGEARQLWQDSGMIES